MATRTTWTSADPNYQSFPAWFKKKIESFTASGNTSTVDAWNAALAAKEAAMAAANYTADTPDDNTIITSSVVADVPAFTNIFSLWVTEYNITVTTTEV